MLLAQNKPRFVIDEPLSKITKKGKMTKATYPFGFCPTLHRYRLNELQKLKKPSTIFVCSMADMFGEWVPDEWIEEVFKACRAAPQHRYLFLTKNPKRYGDFKFCYENVIESNYLFGATVTNQKQLNELITCRPLEEVLVSFLSIEPIFDYISIPQIFLKQSYLKWVIVGAETGNRKDRVIPQREWIERIVNKCQYSGLPVFLKNNLADIWGERLIQEYPWGTKGGANG